MIDCSVLEDCLAVLEEGLKNRSTGSHKLNQHSSRSHSLMTVFVDSYDLETGSLKTSGKISFVDLAGSEKTKDSQATGATLTETLNINKSLLTLGNCISCLADSSKRNGHVPYRDSKLTKLLADSLGGRGIALMIANIGPSMTCLQETLKTLRYAQRAIRVKTRPQITLTNTKEALIARLQRDLKEARMEGDRLRAYIGNAASQSFGNEYVIPPIPGTYAAQPLNQIPHSAVYATPIVDSGPIQGFPIYPPSPYDVQSPQSHSMAPSPHFLRADSYLHQFTPELTQRVSSPQRRGYTPDTARTLSPHRTSNTYIPSRKTNRINNVKRYLYHPF